MYKIELKELDRMKFVSEIKKLDISKNMTFALNDSFARNIDILFLYLKKKEILEHIVIDFLDDKEVDIIAMRFFARFMKNYYIFFSHYFKIEFNGMLQDEIFSFLGDRNYLNYCSNNNIEPKWNENFLEEEKHKTEKYKKYDKYKTFKILKNALEKFPYSRFNFPNEQDVDRFVFYLHMYNDESRTKILNLFEKLEVVDDKITELIKNNRINKEVYGFAIGFSYKNGKLVRQSIYSMFCGILIKERKIFDFLEKKHNFLGKIKYKNLMYYGYDIYSDRHEEIKLYDRPYIFDEEINNIELKEILTGKPTVKVSKFKDNKLLGIKYEFEVARDFNPLSISILKQNNIDVENKKILALYIKDSEIIKSVAYDL